MPTDHPGRVYACARCQREVLVCSGCDRGQRYCSVACRRQARRECLLVAGRRYQSGRAGRFAHARRACRYRRRQKIVTHQASPGHPGGDDSGGGLGRGRAGRGDKRHGSTGELPLVWR